VTRQAARTVAIPHCPLWSCHSRSVNRAALSMKEIGAGFRNCGGSRPAAAEMPLRRVAWRPRCANRPPRRTTPPLGPIGCRSAAVQQAWPPCWPRFTRIRLPGPDRIPTIPPPQTGWANVHSEMSVNRIVKTTYSLDGGSPFLKDQYVETSLHPYLCTTRLALESAVNRW